MARSVAPTSTRRPLARRRGTGSGSSWREPMARREPAGSRTASSATMSWHSRLTRASAWSMTMATGASIEAMTDPRRATSARPAPGMAREPKAVAPIGSTRSSATARYVSRTVGSLSRSSTDSQATRGAFAAAHCASTVVLPYPGGATTAITDPWPGPSSRSTTAARSTMPDRIGGAASFDSSSSKVSTRRPRCAPAAAGRARPGARVDTRRTVPQPDGRIGSEHGRDRASAGWFGTRRFTRSGG